MDEFRIIYRILRSLEKSLDLEEPDMMAISAEYLGVSVPEWSRLMKMLVDDGYIDGIIVVDVDNAPYPFVKLSNPVITKSGLEYLQENSLMKKAANLAKGVRGMLP